ncbi:DUF1405 domain-containing protein [Halorientalis brevis]|uniref:DUF1405 domain-containing protein n=1 Tax=Halorientalis brevis TaxID=1126241 RepID=A0ABD6C7E4_9EURY|nr:DUF1405 domain-containing protein [Halorientalis brevis]
MWRREGRVIPARWAQYYLGNAPSLVWLLVANVFAVLVGIQYYVATMPGVSTFLWPFYVDSPVAVFLMALSIATLLPFIGRPLDAVPRTRVLAYLHTLAFVWLVKMGLWTFVALNLGFTAYFPAVWAYFGIILTHLGFVAEAYLIPHYGATTRGALAAALVLSVGNDILDYGFGLHPPLRYEPTLVLVVSTVILSLLSVALAGLALDRLPGQNGK